MLYDDKIRQPIFSMHSFKTLRVDDLHAIFYQSQWDTVGESICNLVKKVFNSGCISKEVNKTLIVLIPKPVICLVYGCTSQLAFVQ